MTIRKTGNEMQLVETHPDKYEFFSIIIFNIYYVSFYGKVFLFNYFFL